MKNHVLSKWVVPEKIHPPPLPMDGILDILAGGGGSKTLEIQAGGGVKLEKSSAGVSSRDLNV